MALDALIERFVTGLAQRLALGRLLVQFPSGGRVEIEAAREGPSAALFLHRWRGLWRLAIGGDIGFAEAYMAGDWSTPDLAALIELAARNEAAFGASIRPSWPGRLFHRLYHRTRKNTREGSRRNIVAHYDLGNDFYAAWLDPTMSYSSALYTAPGQTLQQAQEAKQDRVLEALALRRGASVLEIGCGWGGLAERLVKDHDCKVTAITLSPAQLDYATRRLSEAGVAAAAELCLRDYREVTGRFDRIVAIEMMEAVGAEYWPGFFAQLRDRLSPTGVAVLQVITIAEDRYDIYRSRSDFIQRHIFPGGMLPSVAIMREQVDRAGLTLDRLEMFGASYARTLAEWRHRFLASWPHLAGGRLDEVFRRKWEYYLAYCEAGFRAGAIDVGLYRVRHAGTAVT